MFDFLEYLAKGEMTPGEQELAYNLTVIYGMSILCMVVLYKLMYPSQTSKPEQEQKQVECDSLPSKEAALNLIKSRRSIMPKDLNGEEVTQEEVDLLLEAANWAPTHQRCEPWRYTVIKGGAGASDYLDRVEDWYSEHKEEITDQEYQQFTRKVAGCKNVWPGKVSHLIIIGMKRQALEDKRLPEWEEICATAASVQNLHLALTSIPGLGGFWSSHTWCRSWRDSAAMREFCGLEDEEDRVFGCMVIGRVDSDKSFKGHRRDLSEKVIWK